MTQQQQQQAGHTPGPWIVSGLLDAGCDREAVNADGPIAIALVHIPADHHCRDRRGAAAANAALIAAAPELLAAIGRICRTINPIVTDFFAGRDDIPADVVERLLSVYSDATEALLPNAMADWTTVEQFHARLADAIARATGQEQQP